MRGYIASLSLGREDYQHILLLPYGKYDIATASAIELAAGVGFLQWAVDDSDGCHKGAAKMRRDSSRNALVLEVLSDGFKIILR